jgi:hypothetical protein
MSKSYTDDEIRAFSNMSYWELERLGLHQSGGRRANQRIERGPGSYVANRKPPRDYLSEPLSELIDWRL